MPIYTDNQEDDEDDVDNEVDNDIEDDVGDAGEVTRPRGIAWWQLSLPSMSPPVLPSSSINNSPGNRKPSMLLHSPSFFHPLLVHRSPSGGSLIRGGGGGGGGGACAAHRLPSGKSLIQSEGALQVPVNRKPASHQL